MAVLISLSPQVRHFSFEMKPLFSISFQNSLYV